MGLYQNMNCENLKYQTNRNLENLKFQLIEIAKIVNFSQYKLRKLEISANINWEISNKRNCENWKEKPLKIMKMGKFKNTFKIFMNKLIIITNIYRCIIHNQILTCNNVLTI